MDFIYSIANLIAKLSQRWKIRETTFKNLKQIVLFKLLNTHNAEKMPKSMHLTFFACSRAHGIFPKLWIITGFSMLIMTMINILRMFTGYVYHWSWWIILYDSSDAALICSPHSLNEVYWIQWFVWCTPSVLVLIPWIFYWFQVHHFPNRLTMQSICDNIQTRTILWIWSHQLNSRPIYIRLHRQLRRPMDFSNRAETFNL